MIHGVLADIDILKRAEAERSHLLRRLASAQEEEQRRISRELHDQIGQTVTGLSLGLKALEQGLAKGSNGEAATEQVRWLEQLAAQIGRDIHRTASDLRPTAIDDLGIFRAIEAYVAEWQERYGVRVDIQTFGRDNPLPPDVAAVLYRLVQEGLTNVLKHAQRQQGEHCAREEIGRAGAGSRGRRNRFRPGKRRPECRRARSGVRDWASPA